MSKKKRTNRTPKKAKASARSRMSHADYLTADQLSKRSGIPAQTFRRISQSPAIRPHIFIVDDEPLFPPEAFSTGTFSSVFFPRDPDSSSSVFVTSGSSSSDIISSLGIGSSEIEAAIKAIIKSSP